MVYQGVLRKMNTQLSSPIEYTLNLNGEIIPINSWIGHEMEMRFCGFECLQCHLNKKIYRQGFCYDCFYAIPQAGDWIMRPELSKAHLGIEDRDLSYESKVQLAPHVVYLSLSSNVKVGVTKKTQIPTRWIDQGATKAINFVEVPNRYLAGITEVSLKPYVADKTNWRKMLKNDVEEIALHDFKKELSQYIPKEVHPYYTSSHADETILEFPVIKYPTKVKSLNLLKSSFYRGRLMGIKGQYLIFEDETVFNVRSHEGFMVTLLYKRRG